MGKFINQGTTKLKLCKSPLYAFLTVTVHSVAIIYAGFVAIIQYTSSRDGSFITVSGHANGTWMQI